MVLRSGYWRWILAAALFWLWGIVWAEDSLILQRPQNSESTSSPPSSVGPLVVPETSSVPGRVSIGINDLGEQFRYHFRRDWAVEQRFLIGQASSNVGTVQANVFGLRGYRFFEERRRWRFYLGIEGDYVHTSIRSADTTNNPNSIATISGFGETSGYAMGGFGGLEFRLLKRIALDVDVGPYMIGLQEKVTKTSDASLDFVANTAINVYLF